MSPRLFATLSTFILFFVITTADAAAQDPAPSPARAGQQRQPPAAPRTTADEEYDLDITERRINEADYAASTAVEAGDVGGAGGLTLRVGVAVRAAEIDVLLRNVRGHVRFRGSLEAVLRRLGLERREAPPPAVPPPSTPSP